MFLTSPLVSTPQYPEITYIVFVTFLVLMSILIMNLLVGLAVDDIKAVQDQAILKRLAMQTQVQTRSRAINLHSRERFDMSLKEIMMICENMYTCVVEFLKGRKYQW